MKIILSLILSLFLLSCGSSGGDSSRTESEVQTCTIVDNIVTCPDGTFYELPEPVNEPIEVEVEVLPEEEDDPLEELINVIIGRITHHCKKKEHKWKICEETD